MISAVLFGAAISLLVYLFCKWATANNDYFEKRGIRQMKPTFLIGNNSDALLRKLTVPEFAMRIYNQFPKEKIFGIFDMRKPVYYVRDVDLIKRLTIKDFEYFEDRSTVVNEDIDQLFGNSMFLMRGEKWRHMRSTLSPAFTGSKMRQMFELVSECASDLVQSLLKQSANSKSINWEMKELFTRYSNDVIASCAFGIKVNSLENVNNEFYQIGRKSLDFSSVKQVLKFLMARVIPFVMKTLKIEIVDGKVIKFFRSMVITTMNVREQEKIYRPDMINILMRYRNGVSSAGPIEDNSTLYDGFATVQETLIARINIKDNWSEKELIAQCFLFYLAAFETTSTQLAFLAYELIVNPGIQEHLYNEIIETDASLNGNHINYDALQKMKYMDQVISEVLRKWPSSANLDRICVKDYVYNDNQSLNLRIDKGSPLIIPIYGIHHDPQYYPEPEIFNPDRFSVENRQKIVVGSYLPFGIGPRNCIGSRFALMELKAVVYYLILNFSLEANAQSQIPVVLKKNPFSLISENGIFVDLKPRKSILS